MTLRIRRDRLAYLALLALLPLLAARAWADEKPAKPKDALDNEPATWMRFVEDGKGGAKLDVAIGTYKNEDGVQVHLVGVVHVADKAYYDGLAKTFEGYDALLYEMVKPAGAGAPLKGQKPGSMIGFFQTFLKDILDLEFQLDAIDYTKDNFIHADLDAETFQKLQAERGESMMGMMIEGMMKQMFKSMQGKGQDNAGGMDLMQLIEAMQSPDRARALKLIMGRSFGDMEEQAAAMQGTVLVTERNKKALEVLRNTIRGGKKNVGVFYGAAHMPDIELRLALMGFKRTGMEWRTAWDMSAKEK